jgi:hypothetical protein
VSQIEHEGAMFEPAQSHGDRVGMLEAEVARQREELEDLKRAICGLSQTATFVAVNHVFA